MGYDGYARRRARMAGTQADMAINWLPGDLMPNEWKPLTGLYRLLLNGTGSISVDVKDSGGNVTSAVLAESFENYVNKVTFPYFGDEAIAIMVTATGTAEARII